MRKIDRLIGLGKFIGDHTGHGIAWGKNVLGIRLVLPITMVTAMVSPSARPKRKQYAGKQAGFGIG